LCGKIIHGERHIDIDVWFFESILYQEHECPRTSPDVGIVFKVNPVSETKDEDQEAETDPRLHPYLHKRRKAFTTQCDDNQLSP
jgi:hypothetical protein